MALDKSAAAAFLGCSERQIERYVKDNRLSVTYEAEPGRTRKKPTFDEEELQRLKNEIAAPIIKPVVTPHAPQNGITPNSDGALSLLSPSSENGVFMAALADFAGRAAVS